MFLSTTRELRVCQTDRFGLAQGAGLGAPLNRTWSRLRTRFKSGPIYITEHFENLDIYQIWMTSDEKVRGRIWVLGRSTAGYAVGDI